MSSISAAKDEWDFAYAGMTNHPFIKGNYPHHEGIWGWGTVADQVVMMVPNIRRSMVECKCDYSFFLPYYRLVETIKMIMLIFTNHISKLLQTMIFCGILVVSKFLTQTFTY